MLSDRAGHPYEGVLDGEQGVGVWPEAKPRILFVDNHCLALVKPFNMPVMEDKSGDADLFNWGRNWLQAVYHKPGRAFLGILHRVDRPAGGLVLFARTSKAAARLSAQFRRRTIKKDYTVLVEGRLSVSHGQLEHWLLKDKQRNRVQVVSPETEDSRLAKLDFELVDVRQRSLGGQRAWVSEVRVRLETGRPHQIRAQFSALGHPVLGDVKYGSSHELKHRNLCLFSRYLEFAHPVGGLRTTLAAPLPEEGWI